MKLSAIIISVVILISHSNLYAETVWVCDRDAGKLFKVSADGKKEEVGIENFSSPVMVNVDQRDGSVWVTDLNQTYNNQVVKLSSNGKELFRLTGFVRLGDAAIDPRDGSYYVTDMMIGEVVKISPQGKELYRIKNLSPVKDLEAMGCFDPSITSCHAAYIGRDINLESIDDVGVSPLDSSVWVADTGQRRLLKFTKEGIKITQKASIGQPEQLVVGYDGACWVNNIDQGRIFKISSDGRQVLAKITGLVWPFELSISPIDKTCWVTTSKELIQISKDGKKIIKRIAGFKGLESISGVNPKDGSFWIADPVAGEIIKVSKSGVIIFRVGGFKRPRFLDVYWNLGNSG